MKKSFFFIVLTILLLLFPACGKGGKQGDTPTGGDKITSRPEDVTITLSPVPTETPTPVPTEVPVFSTERLKSEQLEDSGVFKLTNLPFHPISIFLTEDDQLCLIDSSFKEDDFHFCLLDLMTGTMEEKIIVSKDLNMTSDEVCLMCCQSRGYYLLYDTFSGNVFSVDKELNVIDTHFASFDSYMDTRVMPDGSLLFWEYGTTIYSTVSVDENGKLLCTESFFLIPEGFYVTDLRCFLSDNKLLLSIEKIFEEDDYSNDYIETPARHLIYNLETGHTEEIYLSENTFLSSNNGDLVSVDYRTNQVSLYSTKTPNLLRSFTYPDGYMSMQDAANNQIIFSKDDSWVDDTFSLLIYNLYTGNKTCSLTIPCEGSYAYIESICEYENTSFCLINLGEENEVFYFTRKEEPVESDFTYLKKPSLEVENDFLVQTIKDEYSINVFIRENGVIYNSDYFTVAEFNEATINNALNALYETLCKFPKDFFREIYRTTMYKKINIYLTGTIRKNPYSYNTLEVAGGFVSDDENCKRMTVDINDSGYLNTFAHETMHIIESAIHEKAFASDRDYETLERFDLLNPRGFDYGYSYTDTETNYRFSDYCGSNWYSSEADRVPQGIYFIDDYALTYPTEDIARLFETLLSKTPDTIPLYFNSKPIQQKAAYLCLCIRDCFDCIPEDEIMPWEELLLDRYSLQYFRETFPLDDEPMG